MAEDAISSKMSADLTAQILSRLPPKTLMRFKSIRRSWHALISSPNFADLHLSNSNSGQTNLSSAAASTGFLLKRIVLVEETKETLLSSLNLCIDQIFDSDGGDHLPCALEDLKIPAFVGLASRGEFLWAGQDSLSISSHCDGIVCLTDYGKNVALCNPAIKEFKLLPVSEIVQSSPEHNVPINAVGFGRDVKNSKDYKAVMIINCGGENYWEHKQFRLTYPPKVQVHIVGTDCWKQVEIGKIVTENGFYLPCRSESFYHKGVVYWNAIEEEKYGIVSFGTDDDDDVFFDDRKKDKIGILLFDLGDEVFDIIPHPPGVNDVWRNTFGVWNESIALVHYDYLCQTFDVWVLNDGIAGCSESRWTRCLRIEVGELPSTAAPLSYFVPLAMVKSSSEPSDVLLLVVFSNSVAFYNLRTKRFKYLLIDGLFLNALQALVCVNSIVSIKGNDELNGDDNIPSISLQEA